VNKPKPNLELRFVYALAATKFCSSNCRFFKCGKRALIYRGRIPWCSWTNEECTPRNCQYAVCVKRKLLPNGVCGDTIRRRTVERKPEEEVLPTIRVRGKFFKKLRDKELF